jgi:hypothetical protein
MSPSEYYARYLPVVFTVNGQTYKIKISLYRIGEAPTPDKGRSGTTSSRNRGRTPATG